MSDYKRMFEDAVRDLAAITEALGIDPDEAGGAAPILEVIDAMRPASVAMRVQYGEREPKIISWNVLPDGEYDLYAASVDPRSPISDAQIIKVWEGMPGGADGFRKQWGYLQFARAILAESEVRP